MALRVAFRRSLQRATAASAEKTGPQWQRRLLATANNEPVTENEHDKMVSEGGGSVDSFHEAKENVKAESGGIMDSVKRQVDVEKQNAQKMMDEMKDMPQKTAETTAELKETVAVAGQALKKDAERLAEKVGLRERKPGDLENE